MKKININDFRTEISISTARSGGPGGQNVNKVETKVTLRFNVNQSTILTESQKEIIHAKIANKLTNEGELVISDMHSRSQLINKEAAFKKLEKLINKAFFVPNKRKQSQPTKSSKRKRLDSKKQQSEKKKWRQKPE